MYYSKPPLPFPATASKMLVDISNTIPKDVVVLMIIALIKYE
jgi:hypothetical protein